MTSSGNHQHRRPVIGVTTYLEPARWSHWARPAALIPQAYVDGVARAGGTPVLLPIPGGAADDSPAGAEDAVLAVHALVLAGGADVDPALYGQTPGPATVTRPERDAWELALLRAALAHRRPVLAICRGLQLLNVACGGTLHQHLPATIGHDEHQPAPGRFGRTGVRVATGSRLAGIVGHEVAVSCNHHQAIDRIGDGLTPVAWAADGTIEAVEHPGHGLLLGVQWHPEEDSTDRRLFATLVRAAAAGRAAAAAARGQP